MAEDARIVVVTGTDTEVGKTFVTAALCHALRNGGVRVGAIKPVESGVSGATPGPNEDGVILAGACGQDEPSAALQRLSAPLAPPLAAKLENVQIRDGEWGERVERLAAHNDVVFVEAAGGLLSPISDRFDALSLAEHLGADVLVVGRDSLGTINHTRLVLDALEGRKPPPVGVVLSAPAEPDESTGRNVDAIISASGFQRVIAIGRHRSPIDAARDLEQAARWLV